MRAGGTNCKRTTTQSQQRTKAAFRATFVLLAFGAACASPDYGYRASTPASSSLSGQAAGQAVTLPPESFQVTSIGFAKLVRKGTQPANPAQQPGNGIETSSPALLVQVTVFNSTPGQGTWQFDVREQRIALPHEPLVQPVRATSDSADLPEVPVSPGEKRRVNLFFPLPGPIDEAAELPEFRFYWKIKTTERTATGTLPFTRVEISQLAKPAQYGYPFTPSPYLPYDSDPISTWVWKRDYSNWQFPPETQFDTSSAGPKQ